MNAYIKILNFTYNKDLYIKLLSPDIYFATGIIPNFLNVDEITDDIQNKKYEVTIIKKEHFQQHNGGRTITKPFKSTQITENFSL